MRLPFRVQLWLGRRLGGLAYRLGVAKQRRIAERNVDVVLLAGWASTS